MKTITSIFLINALRTPRERVGHMSDVDAKHSGLLDFKRSLIAQIHEFPGDASIKPDNDDTSHM